MTDNFLDISHFPFVHTGTFGRAQDTHVPKIELGQLDDGFYGYAYEVEVNNDGLGADGQRPGGQGPHPADDAPGSTCPSPCAAPSTTRPGSTTSSCC